MSKTKERTKSVVQEKGTYKLMPNWVRYCYYYYYFAGKAISLVQFDNFISLKALFPSLHMFVVPNPKYNYNFAIRFTFSQVLTQKTHSTFDSI